jgi:peroxiredoxin
VKRRTALLLTTSTLVAMATSHDASAKVDPYRRTVLRDHDGKATSLARLAGGSRLVVVVMKGTWCQVCAEQLGRLAKLEPELAKLQSRVVGLTHDGHEKATKVARSTGAPVASDPKHDVLDALGLWRDDWEHPLPAIVVFDRCGVERGRLPGRRPGAKPDQALLDFLKKLDQTPEHCDESNA